MSPDFCRNHQQVNSKSDTQNPLRDFSQDTLYLSVTLDTVSDYVVRSVMICF